jgi:hypothetical protein
MIEDLNKVFKKYVSVFLQEYSSYLSKDQLERLKDIKYDNAIKLDSTNKPFGIISLGQINLSDYSDELINNLKKMPNYNSSHYNLNNKNLSSYLKYMCDSGYNLFDYYTDILMYFVFKLVIKENNGFINGLINQEMRYLAMKYSFHFAYLYPREEAIAVKVIPLLGIEGCRKIIFSDSATTFKYLNDNKGYRVAKLVNDLEELIEDEYHKLGETEYVGYSGFLDYAHDYDHLSYGEAYNCLLDFEVENELAK